MNEHRWSSPILIITLFCGFSLLAVVGGIIYLTKLTLTVEGNDIAQAGILIGILGSIGTGILGLFGGIAIGRHLPVKKEDPAP